MAEMYNWDKKSFTQDNKSRKCSKNPSFSSTLLDEIYRSIDGGDEKFGEFKVRRPKTGKKPGVKNGSAVEDEEIASFRQAVLVDKWMDTEVVEKVSTGRRVPSALPEFDRKAAALDNDPMFFSSGSSSSDSSFGWYSEAETAKPKPASCFGPLNRPKQVKTSVTPRSASLKQNEFYLFDEDDHQTNKTDHSGLIRSKARAMKIYTSLKKVKQPISPGGRLTTFLNTLFTNGHTKKSKDSGLEDRTQTRTERKSKSTNVSTCSSASSFSRSCLSKNFQSSREQINNGMRRTVRFYPVNVIVDKDSRPCGEKTTCDEKQDFRKLPPTFPCSRIEKPKFNEFPTKYDNKKHDFNDEDDDEDDDMASDSSSDLFELDHLTVFKNEQYFEELPVYETTHLGTNRAIASGLIC